MLRAQLQRGSPDLSALLLGEGQVKSAFAFADSTSTKIRHVLT